MAFRHTASNGALSGSDSEEDEDLEDLEAQLAALESTGGEGQSALHLPLIPCNRWHSLLPSLISSEHACMHASSN